LFTAPVLGWGRYETYEFGCTVAFHDQSNGGYSYVITMLLFVLGIPLCKNWNWNYDYCQFILNVFETSKIKRLKLVFFPFLTHAFLCVSSSKQLLLCLVLHKWLRCKSALCRINNDYVVCDAFDANRYRNL
jgi:hypothetical protein